MEVITGTPFRYGSPIICQCKTPTTRKMAMNPTIIAPTIPKGVRRLANSSPTKPTSAAIINQMIKSPKVMTMTIDSCSVVQLRQQSGRTNRSPYYEHAATKLHVSNTPTDQDKHLDHMTCNDYWQFCLLIELSCN